MSHAPNAVDVHVGARIRAARETRGISQTALGEAYGVTFQQIQKYEKATNRASASALLAFAKILGVSVDFFFEGLDADAADCAEAIDLDLMRSDPKLVRDIAGLSLHDRTTVRRVVQSLAEAAEAKAAFARRVEAMAEDGRAAA
ncbi:MAG: transcriptional regulator [Ancylobacter novellus]|uniref:Transcriptional regulator n=1 Tax=Ancylobacter novellus TaxID=921 RepID=A0A2W5MYW5_ANCNO|nr:MAG: transcriptional regulator [Ancylobacter novellus]